MRNTNPMTFVSGSLQRKLLLAMTLLITIVMGGAGTYWLKSQRQNVSAELEARAAQMANLLSKSCSEPMWNMDLKTIQGQLDAVMADRQVFSVALYELNADNPVIAKTRRGRALDGIQREAPVFYTRNQSQSSVELGRVRIVYTRYYFYQALAKAQMLIVAVFLILLASLSAATYLLLRQMVQKPVGKLVAMARRLTDGDFDAKIPISSRDEIGALAQTFNTMSDKLKHTLGGLHQSEEKYRGIFENALEGIFQSTLEGAFLSANPALARMLSYDSPEELITSITDIRNQLYVEPADYDQSIATLKEYGEMLGREVQFYRRNGQKVWIAISARLLSDDTGKPLFIEGFNADISDRKLTEETIRRINQELEQRVIDRTSLLEAANAELMQVSSQLKNSYSELKSAQSRILQQEKMASIGQLAAGVAHEINNPIGFVTSNLTTLGKYWGKISEFHDFEKAKLADAIPPDLMDEVDAKRKSLKIEYVLRDAVDLIRESIDGTDRVKKIVQGLKSFSRLDEAEFQLADINQCLESTINIAWNELKYKVTLKKEYGELPQTGCYPQQLNQVFLNLLLNAVQSIETQGEVTVTTRHENGYILIDITDTGSGIPPETRDKVFEPFYTTKEVGKGTGLGLSISYDIVNKHGGEISILSEVGEGTMFTVRIPVVDGR